MTNDLIVFNLLTHNFKRFYRGVHVEENEVRELGDFV